MKKLLYLLVPLALAACNKTASEQSETEDSLSVASKPALRIINLAELPAPKTKLDKVKTKKFFYRMLGHDDDTRTFMPKNGKLIVHSSMPDKFVFNEHALINSVRQAYADHRPIVLSPDILWLVITRCFAAHVEIHAEELRHKFVDFEGKKTLSVYTDEHLISMPAEAWEPYFSSFTEQIAAWTSPELVSTLQANFSTTTPAAATASNIMVLSSMKSYFDYEIMELCGIPTVYLEGSPADWKRLEEKATALRKYDLDWWMDELEPVLAKISDAAGGEVDTVFWQSIYKETALPKNEYRMCGEPDPNEKITGWIVKFYMSNEMTDTDISNLPPEIAEVPLRYEDMVRGEHHNLTVASGLVGFSEDPETKAIRPEIAWYIYEAKE